MRLLVCSLLLAATLAAQPAILVLNGNDPVILSSTNKEKEGLPSLTVTRGRYLYQFTTAENKAAFEKDPAQYEVQMNGSCARMGPPVMGGPGNYSVYKGKIYLFGSGDCREAFEDAPEKFIETPEVLTKGTPEEQRRATQLIAKAVEALGGAAKLDGLRAIKIVQTIAGQGERTSYLRFPADFRIEERGRFEQWIVLTPKDSFQVFVKMERVGPLPGAGAAFIRERTLQLPHLMLRQRADFQILGVSKSAEGEFADVVFHGAKFGFLIDSTSGQLRGIRARGRTREGYIADIVTPLTAENYRVELNPELPDTLFERPVFEKK